MSLFDRISSEIAYLRGALRTLSNVTPIAKNPDRTFPDVADKLAADHGDAEALISEHERMSFRRYNERANQYARWAMANGVKKGDCVALMMPNRPEYMALWLGVARAGGVTALLNTNLRGPVLAHCVNIVKPVHVIVDADLVDAFKTAEPHLDPGLSLACLGAAPEGWTHLDPLLADLETANIAARDRPKLTTMDMCLYIYTSGTTGLPKAANINHYRTQAIMFGFAAAMNIKPSDRMYVCLPLYHSTGCLIATGGPLVAGASTVIRDRFSASQFWDDVVDNECTIIEYIGELCRYLLNSPTHSKETGHRLRLACGNGLRPDIWQDFQTRFRIPRILEWYAATEGNAVFFNFDQKVGAVGRIPKWAERKFVVEVVCFDFDTEQPVRGEDGFCIKSPPGEVGEVISQILNDPARPSQRFEGYADKAATEKKILRDVFETGDAWFRTGDLMKKDALGYFYFIDRIGDTFRWKGENVATSEVAEVLTVFPGIREANVYGVAISGMDGRAGMAALATEDGIDLEGFHTHIDQQLPGYARPLFLRIQDRIEATSTFKQRKIDLVKDGFDPGAISDPIYFSDPQKKAFVPLDAKLFEEINAGKIRL